MNRRVFVKTAAVITATPALLLQLACGSTKSLVKWTGILIGALKDVSPILEQMGAAGIVALVARAIPIAEDLKKAFEANDNVKALQFVANLINPQTGIIVQIASAVNALQSDAQKRIIQGVLAIGMVALRLIEANVQDTVTSADLARVEADAPEAARVVKNAAKADALERAFQAVRF